MEPEEATAVMTDEQKPQPTTEDKAPETMIVKKAPPEFVRPLVTEMELPEGGVAK